MPADARSCDTQQPHRTHDRVQNVEVVMQEALGGASDNPVMAKPEVVKWEGHGEKDTVRESGSTSGFSGRHELHCGGVGR